MQSSPEEGKQPIGCITHLYMGGRRERFIIQIDSFSYVGPGIPVSAVYMLEHQESWCCNSVQI